MRLAVPAIAGVAPDRIQAIIDRTGDVDLAIDALSMVPRASWAEAIITAGPYAD